MAGLIEDDTDVEMGRYEEAYQIKTHSGLSPANIRGGTVQYDPARKVEAVYVDLPSGGKLRIGDRPVTPMQVAETDAAAAKKEEMLAPQPGATSTSPVPTNGRAPIESIIGGANGPELADYEAAGYTEAEVMQYEKSRTEQYMAQPNIADAVKLTPDQISQYAAQPGAEMISDYQPPEMFEGAVSETVKGLARGGLVNPSKFLKENFNLYDPLVFQIVDPKTGEFDPQLKIVSREEKTEIDRAIAAGEMPFALDFEQLVQSDTEAGPGAKMIGGLSQFIGAFAGVGKLFKVGSGLVGAASQGAAADFLGFEGNEGRLTDLLLELGVPENRVTDFLRTDPNDPDYVGRFKNALEGGVLGVIADQIAPVYRMIKEGGSKTELGQAIGDLRFQSRQLFSDRLSDVIGAGRAIAQGDTEMLGEVFQRGRPPQSLSAAAPTDRPVTPEYLQQIGVEVPPSRGGLPGRISTRLPTAAKATEDPMTGELIIGYDELKADPKVFEPNVNIVRDYPNMRPQPDATTDETAEQFITHVKDNLLYLHDQVPEATRARSQLWYDGARNITDRWSKEYGVADTGVAGALAALSPQKDWYQNVSLAQRVLNVVKSKGNNPSVFSPEMEQTFRRIESLNKPKYEPLLDAIKGKSYDEITDPDPAVQNTLRALFVRLHDQTYSLPEYKIVGPEGDFLDVARNADGSSSRVAWGSLNEIGKAIGAIEANGNVSTISRLMGERHKVRNFYNNIYDPNSPYGDVTIDTHAVAAGLLRPLSGNSLEVDHNFKNMSVAGRGTTKGSAVSGVSGNYGLYAEAYRRAAAERGILPRQMQSITWEAVRGLFPDTFKTAKNNADVDAIWTRYRNGEIEIDEARSLVSERAGGIRPPSWQQQ